MIILSAQRHKMTEEAKNMVMNPSEPFESWPYRCGMASYKLGTSAFFAAGGLGWLKKKYKYQTGLDERMGKFQPGFPKDALWIHAVSVGEVQSALPLIDAAKEDSKLPCVLSTATVTGRNMAERLLSCKADAMIYSPWDASRFVKRALDTLMPKAYIAMETERWPVILSELRARKIPAFLVSGRLSRVSAKRLCSHRRFWLGVLCCFERLLVRFETDREAFASLGVPDEKIVVTGDCKVDAVLKRRGEANLGKWAHLRRDGSPLFLAGSTHEGEERIVLEAFRKTRTAFPASRLIITPRYPERAAFVAALAEPYGKTALLSNLSPDWDVAVVDRIGLLFDLYAIADAAFIGGSFIARGGQNPLEPALFGIQVTHGSNMRNFPDTGRMDALGAAQSVNNADELAEAWLRAPEPNVMAGNRRACAEYFKSIGGSAPLSWKVIKEYL
jgi:3-deoxy-D-manno-octulosonic-acid transferase